MRLRKYFIPRSLIMVTFRTEEGLPFVPTETINTLLLSALGRAHRLYKVKIVGFTIQKNHVHIFLIVEDPELIPKFIGYFKAESAGYLNRLLDKHKRTVWAEGYDSPVCADYHKALEMLAYDILNPVKDGLVASMKDYPGVSSYEMMMNGDSIKTVPDVTRNGVTKLRNPHAPWNEDAEFLDTLRKNNLGKVSLEVNLADMRLCFPESRDMSEIEFLNLITKHIREIEKFYIEQRNKKPVIGRSKLIRSSMLKTYVPASRGKRMICLSSLADVRAKMISRYKYLAEKAKEAYQDWKRGKNLLNFPAGMFAPSLPRYANFLPKYGLGLAG